MKEANPGVRVSKYFRLDRDQSTLDFVDVPIGKDVRVYVDPSRLRSIDSPWAAECNSILQHFFETLLRHLQAGDDDAGLGMLEHLTEKNEFHLGQSKGISDGRAFGPEYARKVWTALKNSKARSSGLLQDIEDTCLFIDGIGPDRISDAICNIIRGPLIKYTQDMCGYYQIPLTPDVDSGPIWDPLTDNWQDELLPLPMTPYGKILFVPKAIVRHSFIYDYSDYYRHYLLPAMQESEKALNTALVTILKNGAVRVTKKDLCEKYGVDKLAVVDQTIRHPSVLDKYKAEKIKKSRPITNQILSEVENIPFPDYASLLKDVLAVPLGKAHATDYENAIEKLLSALLYPSLAYPEKQQKIHEGRKRIDIRYTNVANSGFFHWLLQHYPSAFIFVECKNYGTEVGNPEVDQLSGRFSPGRGQVGLLVCRAVEDEARLQKRCIDTAKDSRGFIISLTDVDLKELVQEYMATSGEQRFALLRRKFEALIM